MRYYQSMPGLQLWKWILIVGLASEFYVFQCDCDQYRIGIFLAEPCANNFSDNVNVTVQDAIDVLNERLVAQSVEFSFTVFPFCDEQAALANIDKVFTHDLDIIVGITSYKFHNSFATFSDIYRKPYFAANSFIWTRVTDYAFSTANSFYQYSLVMGQILDNYKWQGVVSITTDDAFWLDLNTELYIQLNLNDFKMKKNVAVKSPVTHEDAVRVLEKIEISEKAVMLCMSLEDQKTVLYAASNLSIGEKHAFFTFATSRYDVTWNSLLGAAAEETDGFQTDGNNIMESVFVIAPHFPGVTTNTRAKRSVMQKESNMASINDENQSDFPAKSDDSNFIAKSEISELPNANDFPVESDIPAKVLNRNRRSDLSVTSPRYLSSIYDSVLVIGYAVDNFVQMTGNEINQSVNLINYIKNVTFNSTSRLIAIDEDALTMYNYRIYDYSIFRGRFEAKIEVIALGPRTWQLNVESEVLWPSNTMLNPDLCFKQGSGCDEGQEQAVSTITIIIIFVIIVAVLIIGTVSFYCARRYLARNEMRRGPHKLILQPSDLTFLLRKDMGKGSRVMKSTLLDKPDLVKASEPNRSTTSLTELSDYTDTARFNGELVHVKELSTKGFEMKSRMMDYIKIMRDLRHENINPYVGLLVDPVKPALVTEYCSRGSLQDVIRNETIKLDWDFKYSLIIDLVRGIRYLHNSSLKYHGYLKSTNCVIDSRWVLKLTDYGLPGFLGRVREKREQSAKDLVWTAPEFLREVTNQKPGSEKGDVFSFAIIMQEVALRTDPYSSTGLTPAEIIKKLKKPPPLIRPSVSPQFAPPPYIQLMKECWSELPDMRPGVEEIYDQFKRITSGKKANIVDTMFRMLEKYSNDLEEIVNERTDQLEEEKVKTDQLLSRMLPPAVADYLKSGKQVEAETFAEVTIYFSDIVGFTTISAMSTPMQVVDLLNDLYTMFDATIQEYDVYKVETIGDAYMVVSGLPTRIGYKHAGEISTMALDLLSQCGTFKIRHMPDVPLLLRIGLHTGSCVAGVVGLTMPRYCLFGDTVNTASRMESTGTASRIHVSEETKEVLYVLGGYKLEFRGMVELKGKGKRPTYWLTGKEGFTKPLPTPPEIVGEDNHGLASVLSVDNLSTMINNSDSAVASTLIQHATIEESHNEDCENSDTINFKAANENSLSKTEGDTQNQKPAKNVITAEVTVEKPPSEKDADKKDSTKPQNPVRKISPSALSLSDGNINVSKTDSHITSSSQSTDNIPKRDVHSPNNFTHSHEQKKSRKLQVIGGKTGPLESINGEKEHSWISNSPKNGSRPNSGSDVQLNHLDETKKKKRQRNQNSRERMNDMKTTEVHNASSKVKNDTEQRISDTSVSTVISVVSTSDIDVINDKLEKCQNDVTIKKAPKSSSSETLPPVSHV